MDTSQMSLNQLQIGRKANVSALTSDGATRRRSKSCCRIWRIQSLNFELGTCIP